MKLIPLPAFQDNYLWLLHDGQRALVVDPGDAAPVQAHLDEHGLRLEAILVNHLHPDPGPAQSECEGALAGNTRGCPTYEFTVSSLKFGTAVAPGTTQLIHYRQQCGQKRSHGEPTLPATNAVEHGTHPFLRTRRPAVAQAAHGHDPVADPADPVAVFAALRPWKNESR